MSKLSVVVITKDEEANITRCLESVGWADELIVVDSGSTDRTVEIARQFGAKILEIGWDGYGPAKRTGVDAAGGDWVLNIDADEQVSGELAEEIKQVVDGEAAAVGYEMPRRTRFLTRWIYHCGWYPDYVTRLFRRDKGNFDDAPIHEAVILDGPKGRLEGELLHYCFVSLEQYLTKFNRYTSIGADAAYNRGKRTNLFDLTGRPVASFFAHYVARQGFRDGFEGFVISVLSAVSVFVKYAKLRHLAKKREGNT